MNESVATVREPPLRVGRYEVLLPLADDGFVTTSIARVRGPSAGPPMVELVRVASTLSREAEVRAAFLAEARAAGRIRHANFATPSETFLHEGDLFGATEFVLGVRLEDLLHASRRAGTPLPVGICGRIVLDVLAGLSAVHATTLPGTLSRPLVHGDVAPSNIAITYRGEARLVHSGLSVAASRIGAIGRRNPRLAYKAPEQLLAGLHAVPIGPGADLFATAVISWEMLANQPLFDAESDLETVEKVLHAPVLTTEAMLRGRGVAEPIGQLLSLALDRRPDRPTTSAADFGDALEQAMGSTLATGEDVALFVDQLMGPAVDALREGLQARVSEADAWASEHAGGADRSGEIPSRSRQSMADRAPPSSGRMRGRSPWPPGMPSAGTSSTSRADLGRTSMPWQAEPTDGTLPSGADWTARDASQQPSTSDRGGTARPARSRASPLRARLPTRVSPRPAVRVGVYVAIGALLGLISAIGWQLRASLRSAASPLPFPIRAARLLAREPAEPASAASVAPAPSFEPPSSGER